MTSLRACACAKSVRMEMASPSDGILQRIIVIRHGERLDCVDYSWTDTAARPYDPPLTESGVQQARETGKRFVGKVRPKRFYSENVVDSTFNSVCGI